MLKPLLLLTSLVFIGTNFVHANVQDLCSQDNAKSCPLTLSDPTPAILDSVACDAAPFDETYTVTSHVSSTMPFSSFDIVTLVDDDAFSTVSVTGGTCVTVGSVPGYGTCTVIVTITPECSALAANQKADFPQTIDRNLVIKPKSNQELTKNIDLQVTASNGEYTIIVSGLVSGLEAITSSNDKQAGLEEPFLTVHTSDNIWKTLAVSGLDANAFFSSSTCLGANCIAVGEISSTDVQPLVYYSNNTGIDWSASSLPLPDGSVGGKLQSVACNSSQCSAVGKVIYDPTFDYPTRAVEYVSTNGGQTWTGPYTSADVDLSIDSDIQTVSCGNTCIATGTGRKGTPTDSSEKVQSSFIVSSKATQITFFVETLFFDSACSGDTCIAVGLNNDPMNTGPFITRSNDLWGDKNDFTDIEAEPNSNFFGASCTDVADKVFCMVVGGTPTVAATGESATDIPLVYINTDTANVSNDWEPVTPEFTSVLTAVSCVTIDNSPVCTVAGTDSVNNEPFILDWVDGKWSNNEAGTYPALLTSVACTETSGTATCAVAGANVIVTLERTYLSPFLSVNTDVSGSGSWQTPSTTPGFPSEACFSNAGASGVSSGLLLALDEDTICHFLNRKDKVKLF